MEKVSLEEVFTLSDAVSLHTPVTDETVGLIQYKHFKLLKHGATFINTARGVIVREDDMLGCALERPDVQFVLDVRSDRSASSKQSVIQFAKYLPHAAQRGLGGP